MRIWESLYFLLYLCEAVAQNTAPEVCAELYREVDQIYSACEQTCSAAGGGIPTTFGAINLGLPALYGSTPMEAELCAAPAAYAECDEPLIDYIQNTMNNLVTAAGAPLFPAIREKQVEITRVATAVAAEYAPVFQDFAATFTSKLSWETVPDSKQLATDLEQAFNTRTQVERADLIVLIQQLESELERVIPILTQNVTKLANRTTQCDTMINTIPPAKVCQRARGVDEYSYCCCRTNGLAVYDAGAVDDVCATSSSPASPTRSRMSLMSLAVLLVASFMAV